MLIKPKWPAPPQIHAFSTLRNGGVSEKPYDSFNLGTHVADNIKNVIKNRQILHETLKLPNEPVWLKQVHGKVVLPARDENREKEADATFADQPNQVCVIMTADCLPVLLCDRQGKKVAAVHAGWRGLAQKILSETLQQMQLPVHDVLVWLGPAISPTMYQVGAEVRESFPHAKNAFTKVSEKQWLCDLYQLARNELQDNGVTAIYGGEYCTHQSADQFFSYRRDGAFTGRMASLIWCSQQ